MERTSEQPQPGEYFRALRFGLEGALVGTAAVGILAWVFGAPQRHVFYDGLGAVIGFVIVLAIRNFFPRNQ